MSGTGSTTASGIERQLAIAFGVVFILLLLALAIWLPQPTPFQYMVFRIVLALAAAGVASMIPGFLQANVSNVLRSGGAISVFVIVYFFSPAALIIAPPPNVTRNDQAVKSERVAQSPKPLSTSACQEDLGAQIGFWDFDEPNCNPSAALTSASDFWFKPSDPNDPQTEFGVVPYNGAKFAPRNPESFPWEIGSDRFTTAQGVYTVPQMKRIPCITNKGLPCQFQIWIERGSRRLTFYRYQVSEVQK